MKTELRSKSSFFWDTAAKSLTIHNNKISKTDNQLHKSFQVSPICRSIPNFVNKLVTIHFTLSMYQPFLLPTHLIVQTFSLKSRSRYRAILSLRYALSNA